QPAARSTSGMDRRNFLRLGGTGLAGAVLLGTAGGGVLARTGSSLRAEFEAAAKKTGVPVELLLAMGYVNTLWEMPPPDASEYEEGDLHGRGAYGIMQLLQNPSRNTLGRAASLTGLSEKALKNDRAANVRGGAAVLSDIVGKSKPEDLNGWQEAVSEYGDTELYAVEVYETLKTGAALTISTGERLELAPQENVDVPQVLTTRAGADYARASWRPAHYGNYSNANRGPARIDKIVIHVAQGSYSGTINWFQNPRASASAHYVVSAKGRVAQCVRDEDIAWHAGWWETNKRSIGIEHAGYVGNPRSFTKRMYRSSARLAAYLCRRYGIPVNHRHIIGHHQVPGCSGAGGGVSCHTDPGRHWNWPRYIRLVGRYT
ncbi:MAG TPA: peptidoglycan recognition family protein, partial [Rubrobacter sp.]|nr:peptidoglycan recognition family protein [Rubrobacter sp.]